MTSIGLFQIFLFFLILLALTKPMGRNHIIEFQPGQGVHRIVLDVDEVKAAEQRVQLD